ncbi:MAG: tol-pal system protein YbgF [Halomonas sp.]
MRHGLKRLCGAGALVLPLSVWLPATAQQPVVEDLNEQSGSFYQQTETRESGGGSLVMFNQVQEHQEELRRLRGQVEELRHQLEQLRSQTRQQYMDLEDRLATMPSGMGSAPAEESVDADAARQVSESTVDDAIDADVQEAYQEAFAHVQERDFDRAIDAFEAFVGDHPDSRLTPNAHYWLGELHAAEGRLEPAEAAFTTVLEEYPESSKVPDALYKLGLLKARQGDPEASRELLERVREEYAESTAAGLAGDFLRQSGN